jgi:hypothetical protein
VTQLVGDDFGYDTEQEADLRRRHYDNPCG